MAQNHIQDQILVLAELNLFRGFVPTKSLIYTEKMVLTDVPKTCRMHASLEMAVRLQATRDEQP
jgi:hypothetical protein